MRPPSQRRALGALFVVLAIGFAVVGVAAIRAEQWVIVLASAAMAGWIGGLGVRGLRGPRRGGK